MHTRLAALVGALAASAVVGSAPALAETYPASGTYAAAADLGTNFFNFWGDPPFVPQVSTTDVANTLASIATADYRADARTTLGGNHAYAQAGGFSNGAFSVNSFSGWYDQVTLTGGTGTGTLQFSVQLTGSVSAGAFAGGAYYGLYASPLHPEQLVDTLNIVDPAMPPTAPWALYASQVRTIASYDIVASPYNDPSLITGFFAPLTPAPDLGSGIPAIPNLLGGEDGMGFPEFTPDLIVMPGTEHLVNVTLTGTFDFTYGEAFYLIGALGTTVVNPDAFQSFCSFDLECPPNPPVDGTGATTLDFLNSALLAGIVLPEGATFASASGAAYNVTAVPEPGEWAMLLAGLGLVAWRARRRTA
jgi:hypothetical protein